MRKSFTPFRMTSPGALPRSSGAAIYIHPDDVASDPELTLPEKRAILASWISDARAVENAPSMRRLDSGAVVEVDAILRALVSLDDLPPCRRGDGERLPPSGRRRGVILRLLRRVGPAPGANDNDDDPPPAPAGLGVPFRPKPLSPADGARLQPALELELACA
jgi:hypothetical protein